MKKFIPSILLLCLFAGSCNVVKSTKETLKTVFASYYLVQQYTITASKNKTYVEASVYYMADRENIAPKFVSKIEFNGIEMNKGLLKIEPDFTSPCPEKEEKKSSSQIVEPEPKLLPKSEKTPEPTAKESDFYAEFDDYKINNVVKITSQDNKIETYQINFDPLDFKNPESVKISRPKDNLIELKGKGSEKKDDLWFNLTQGNGIFVDNENTQFDSVTKTIKIPAKLLKKFQKGPAEFSVSSRIYASIKTPNVGGNGFSVSYTDNICAEIIE